MSKIISGRARGAKLIMPKGDKTRPTSHKVREALFSAVASWLCTTELSTDEQLKDVVVADLCAGSGAVGFEALSRGATKAYAVEIDRSAAKLIRKNAEKLNLPLQVRNTKASSWVNSSEANGINLVFIDPPYETENAEIYGLTRSLIETNSLADLGLVIIERSIRSPRIEWPEVPNDCWERHYGETVLYYAVFRREHGI